MESVLSTPPLVIAAMVLAVALGLYGMQKYQRCPHCGRFVRRAIQGWLRCGSCGRQYRKGLRVR